MNRKRWRTPNTQPILLKLLFPIVSLMLLVVALIFSAIFAGGVISRLEQNASDILYERVLNRKNYLENEMLRHWSNVSLTVEDVNLLTQELLQQEGITAADLAADSKLCAALIRSVSDSLISMLRSNGVNGVFLVLNTDDLSETSGTGQAENKFGIYLRDLDSASTPSYRNADLLLLCSPSDTVRDLGISTDSAWNVSFDFSSEGYAPFLYEPYMAAYTDAARGTLTDLSNYGYWGTTYRLPGDTRSAISYSVPLILPDGTIYGVLGMELLQDSLRKMLPYDELAEDRMGTYALAIDDTGDLNFEPVLVNGHLDSVTTLPLSRLDGPTTPRYRMESDSALLYCSVEYLQLYNSNTAFSSQRWAVIGVARSQDLFSVSLRTTTILIVALLLSLIIGLIGSILVSWAVSRPVTRLSHEMKNTNPKYGIQLKRTGIVEIDRLIVSMENLSENVIDAANKFSTLLEMASIRIAGFEMSERDGSIFITNNFFDLFGDHITPISELTPAALWGFLDSFSHHLIEQDDDSEDRFIYKIPEGDGYVYIRLRLNYDHEHVYGLLEDITQEMIEVEKIEYERDHDILTSLMNRRAFGRVMRRLLSVERESLKVGALVMLDLDNLKTYNDTYGHAAGDIYIQTAAEVFRAHTPPGTIVSRIAGDEFCLFFHGHDSKDAIRNQIVALREGVDACVFNFDGTADHVMQVSAGVAWFPDDADNLDLLLKYADFAMYVVKRSEKNEVAEFDLQAFQQDLLLQQSKSDLLKMIENKLIPYHFQPIVRSVSGEIIGYEALMRPDLSQMASPNEILALARQEGRLSDIEVLTWTNALSAFASHVESGLIAPDRKLFINSLSSQILPHEVMAELEQRFAPYLANIVMEVTESDELSNELLRQKVEKICEWRGEIALDDYGSGYSNETTLLRLNPKYIKIDINIIRGIDQDANKQKLTSNIVSYAQEREMLVIAEGLETEQEFKTLLDLGVDCVQGFYIACPNVLPPNSLEP